MRYRHLKQKQLAPARTVTDSLTQIRMPSRLLSYFVICSLHIWNHWDFTQFPPNAVTNCIMLHWAGESYVNSDRRSSALLLPPMPAPVVSAEGPRYDNSSVGSSMPSSCTHKHKHRYGSHQQFQLTSRNRATLHVFGVIYHQLSRLVHSLQELKSGHVTQIIILLEIHHLLAVATTHQ